MPAPGAARSFWLQEALTDDPGDRCPPLTAKVSADVCIVGAGFTGRSGPRSSSPRGIPDCGSRSSNRTSAAAAQGRNGGFFSSSWWDAPATCALFGEDEGLRYLHAVADTVHEAGAWLEANGVDAWFHHEGTMRVATGPWQTDVDETSAAAFLEARGWRSTAADPARRGSGDRRLTPIHRGAVRSRRRHRPARRGSREACVVSRSSEGSTSSSGRR